MAPSPDMATVGNITMTWVSTINPLIVGESTTSVTATEPARATILSEWDKKSSLIVVETAPFTPASTRTLTVLPNTATFASPSPFATYSWNGNGAMVWNLVGVAPYVNIENNQVQINAVSSPIHAQTTSKSIASTTTITSKDTTETTTSEPSSVLTSAAQSSEETSISQTSSPTAASSKSTGLSGGAAAGIAIGCLLAGALVAGLLVWFCLGRRRKGRVSGDQEASAAALMVMEKGTQSLDSGSPITLPMENGLPQPLEDKAISGEVSKISNSIKNHVQSFYHNGRVSPGLLDLDDIQALGENLPMSTGTLSTLLGNAATREIALRFCIAWVIVTRMQFRGQMGVTFLPPEVAQCAESISKVNRDSRVHSLFFAKWRTITAELMQSVYVRNPFSAGDPRNQSISAAMEVLEGILRPYADSRMDSSQRQKNLEEILRRAASFAFTLFAQPSSWDFDWQDEDDVKSGSLCIFPALVQTADESGVPVSPPRPFNEAVVRRLDD